MSLRERLFGKGRRRTLGLFAAAPVLALLGLPTASLVYEMGGGENCARCHEIAPNYEVWRVSTHHDVNCTECHGDALTLSPDFHLGNIRRVQVHVSGEIPEHIGLRQRDVKAMTPRCQSCHEQEFRNWSAGAHSTTYARIFADPQHNNKRLLMDDCMRCHGMHFPGQIEQLVTPVSLDGPWRIAGTDADDPAIPCLGCHAMHVDASDAKGGFFLAAEGNVGGKRAKLRPSLGLFDRRTQRPIPARLLPTPAIVDGGKPVAVDRSPQTALCYQCHAPYANMQAGSDDDKTPLGKYEGMACLDCHEKHTLKARQPCAGFHENPAACEDKVDGPAKPVVIASQGN